MIICGYAGIGKSYLAHNYCGVMDLESTPFEKDWERYAKCAIHYSKQGYLVLCSCHQPLREIFCKEHLFYGRAVTIFPSPNDKNLYRTRYVERGNTEEFIYNQMVNWDEWTSEDNKLFSEHLEYMCSGETLYDTIIRLSKEEPYKFCNYDGCPASSCSEMKGKCVNPLLEIVNLWELNFQSEI